MIKIIQKILQTVIILCFFLVISCSSILESSPQGQIAYVDINGNIKILELSGESYVLIDGPQNSYPNWSSDGNQLAYIRNAAEIWVYNFDTGETSRVHREYSRFISYLDWADDNLRIYFHSGGATATNDKIIRCINLDSSKFCRKFKVHSDGGFDISNDGLIAYFNFRNAETMGYGISINDIQNSVERTAVNILPSQSQGPAWSPDATYIALYIDKKLIKILSNGRGQVVVGENVDPNSWEWWHEPTISWSSDGSHIAYEDDGHIWITDADGENEPQKVVQGIEPSWRP